MPLPQRIFMNTPQIVNTSLSFGIIAESETAINLKIGAEKGAVLIPKIDLDKLVAGAYNRKV